MADQTKQYEIVFMLKAALDSSMNNFSALGGKIKELEEKVKGYQDTIGKIDAFRKQGVETLKLKQEYAQTSTKLQEASQRFNETSAAVRTTEEATRQHQTALQSLEAQIEAENRAHELNIQKMREEGAEKKLIAQEDEKHKTILEGLTQERMKEVQAVKESKAALNEAKAAEETASQQKKALSAAVKEAAQTYKQHESAVKSLNQQIKEEERYHALNVQALQKQKADKQLLAQEEEKHKAILRPVRLKNITSLLMRNALGKWRDDFHQAIKQGRHYERARKSEPERRFRFLTNSYRYVFVFALQRCH